jgi:hypothetical protein
MLDPNILKPITGSFVNPMHTDTGTNNWGRKEWENNFRLMKNLGMDTIIVIRCEVEHNGQRWSALDPRSTTWPEDPDLLSMFFRLCDETEMKLYLGGTESITNLHQGEWRQEIADNREFYETMLKRFGHHPCLHGLYLTIEALPWHFNFFDIAVGIGKCMRDLAPNLKTLFSPTFNGLKGDLSSHYTPEEFEKSFSPLFDQLGGILDFCAWQDKFCDVPCQMGQILTHPLDAWYEAAGRMMRRNGIELWANIEAFQRSSQAYVPSRIFRQADYRTLIAKIEAASRHVEKLITYEFASCLSPDAEWGSSGRLLQRYIEALGLYHEKI